MFLCVVSNLCNQLGFLDNRYDDLLFATSDVVFWFHLVP
jgi:hypothetical protein